jgi:hypothetical protein
MRCLPIFTWGEAQFTWGEAQFTWGEAQQANPEIAGALW